MCPEANISLAWHVLSVVEVLHPSYTCWQCGRVVTGLKHNKHDLYFKLEKCTFHAPSMDYLGVILEKGVTHMDPAKITGVDTWPMPKNATEV